MRTVTVSNRRLTMGFMGLAALLGLWALVAPQWALAANTLQDISYSAVSGNKLQIVLTTAAPAAEPLSFTTDNPARIALDLADTQSGLSSKNIAVEEVDVEKLKEMVHVKDEDIAKLDEFVTHEKGNDK